MATGLAVLAGAVSLLLWAGRGVGPRKEPTRVIAPDPTAIMVSARDVSVVIQVYEPGQSSGWHQHSGIHAVAVLSGVLTVYDVGCHAETFEPGRPYVGGQQPHFVANETDAPVTMAVTYMATSGPIEPGPSLGVLPPVHHRSPEEQGHGAGHQQRDQQPHGEDGHVAHDSPRGRTIPPRERIDGTQSPTKMPCVSFPANHSSTEKRKEMKAATRIRVLAPTARRCRLSTTLYMVSVPFCSGVV
jgi:quercetin dioxygenase-like cupin family protein